MPLYEYTCKKCHSQFEELVQSPGEEVHCPHCDSLRVEKVFSTFGVGSTTHTACGLREAPPECGHGACPSCMN